MPHGVLDKPRSNRSGKWRERLRPVLFVVGSLAGLIVLFVILAFVFANYYVSQQGK